MRRQLCCPARALVVLMLMVMCGVTARSNVSRLEDGWDVIDCSQSTLAFDNTAEQVLTFRVHLVWSRNASQIRALIALGPEKSIVEKLTVLRAVAAPPPSSFQQVRVWLGASIAPFCEFDWDSVLCRRVPALAVARRFSNLSPLCRYRSSHSSSSPVVYRLQRPLPRDVLPPCIESITGLYIGSRLRRPKRGPTARSRRSPSSRGRFELKDPNAPDGAWALGTGSAYPVVLDVTVNQSAAFARITNVYVAINCYSGTGPTVYNDDWTKWCTRTAEKNDAPPTSITIDFSPVGGTVTYDTQDDVSAVCGSGHDFYPDLTLTSTDRHAAVCNIDVTSAFAAPLPLFTKVPIRVSATFPTQMGGLDAVTLPLVPAQGFFEGVLNGLTVDLIAAPLITPQMVREQYRVPTDTLLNFGEVQGVVAFTDLSSPGQGISLVDLAAFINQDRMDAKLPIVLPPLTASEIYPGGLLDFVGNASIVDTDETTLDLQWIMSLGQGAHTILWNVVSGPDSDSAALTFAESFVEWSQSVLSPTGPVNATPPSVWSISYCDDEWTNDDYPNGEDLARTLNKNFALMTAAGITVAAAAGDWGAIFDVDVDPTPAALYPASAPHVIAVGGTQWTSGASATSSYVETACSAQDSSVITTGGGYSQYFTQLDFQADVTTVYTNAGLASSSSPNGTSPYRSGMRAVPDVSLVAAQFAVLSGGQYSAMFGTSGSTPIFAAFVTMVNTARARNRLGPVPFMSQMLYLNSAQIILNDVTSGSNCAGEIGDVGLNFASYGTQCYSAAPGWDAVSGLGTLNVTGFVSVGALWDGSVTPNPTPSTDPEREQTNREIVYASIGLTVTVLLLGFAVWAAFRTRSSIAQRSADVQVVGLGRDEEMLSASMASSVDDDAPQGPYRRTASEV